MYDNVVCVCKESEKEMTILLKMLYWVGGIFLGGILFQTLGAGNEQLAETNITYWIGETILCVGWFVGLAYLSTRIWKD